MSTRGVVLFEEGDPETRYKVYYQHCDTYPTGLGIELAKLLKQGKNEVEIIQELELEDYKRTITKPEDAYLKVQGDLEWIYVVNLRHQTTRSLEIFKTSDPSLIDGPDFVFSAWYSYVQYFPKDIEQRFAEVQRTAATTLKGIAAYHRAANRRTK